MDAFRGPQGLEGSALSHPFSQCTQHPCFHIQQAGTQQSTLSSPCRDLHPGTAARQLPAHTICPWLWGPCSPLASSPAQHLPLSQRCWPSSASPCLPTPACSAHASVPGTAPAPALPLLSAVARGLRHHRQRTRELPWHMVHREHCRAQQPPTCLRAASQARKGQRFLRSPSPGAFSSGTRWPWPNWGVLPGLLLPGWRGRAGVRAQLCVPWLQPKPLRSGLGDARQGGRALLPGLARAAAVCSGGAAGQHQLPVCAGKQTSPGELVGRVLAACSWWGAKPLVLRDNWECKGRALPVQTQ